VRTRYPTSDSRHAVGGFTLVELLIAIFILAVGLTFVFALFPVGIYATRENAAQTRAAILARSALASISAARVIDNFDTADWAILARDADDTVCVLRSGQDGLGPDDVRDTDTALYCWMAVYARPVLSETATDTSPADALRVHIAVVRTGRAEGIDELFATSSPFAGRVLFVKDSTEATIDTPPGNRDGFTSGNYVCDLRSGCWYRIQELKDTDGNDEYDMLVLDRAAEYTSNGSVFDNALFVPNVVAVFDGMVSRSGQN